MNFIENIFRRLTENPARIVLQEVRGENIPATASGELLGLAGKARAFLRSNGIKKGDRCALVGHNSVSWIALDLALMAEGIIVVPLYARQAAGELVGMMKDCTPSLVFAGDNELRDAIAGQWPEAPPIRMFDEVFESDGGVEESPLTMSDTDPVTIIYTSGTSGEPKGVVLNVANLTYMLGCTNARLDLLMGPRQEPDRVFHYLPFCFAGSWVLLLTCLSRHSVLTMSTDLNKLADEMRSAGPNYFLNVPALLERVRSGVEEQLRKKGGIARAVYDRGKAAWFRRQEVGTGGALASIWIGLANALVFRAIKTKIGPNLVALICGSAPLARETQLFFMMLRIPVLQVYGLTETTAICTMDHPHQVTPGRVGPAIPGIEMKLVESDEILVRGPNIFSGYWNRPDATAKSFVNDWFRTGDQGEADESGNWTIIGRVKNLIVLSSGHNVAPEPIEEMLLGRIKGAAQVVLVGHGRSYLSAIVTGGTSETEVGAAVDSVNSELPHYKRIRAFQVQNEPFTIENGFLTANGKLKRDLIAARLQPDIERLYRTTRA